LATEPRDESPAARAHTSSAPLPWYVNLANRIELLIRKLGINAIDLRMESLLDRARKQTGLEDFGDHDFRPAMKVLLDSYETEGGLSLLGRVGVRTSSLLSLTGRLEIQRQLALHPEILETPIRRPIFILGFPRTGTTVLHNLLGQGRGTRAPRLWELERPFPPIGPDTPQDDPRAKQTERALEQTYKLLPHLRAVHAFDAYMPEECVVLLRKTFTCASFTVDGHLPSYFEWFLRADLLPIYREFKKMLQLLMWKFPDRHLVLKSPLHLFALDALFEVFPDARIIQTHRDPRTVAGSGCSLYEVLRSIYTVRPHPEIVGRDWLGCWGAAMARAMKARREADAGRFYDAYYQDIVADPVAVVRKIHERFEMDFDAETAARGQEWLRRNPSEKHGSHSYSEQRYGIDAQGIERHFGDYKRRFGL
jgi:hypothetical protein